jgi:hypothetical protein
MKRMVRIFADFFWRLRGDYDEAVTQSLNEVYADSIEGIDSVLMQVQIQSLPVEEWSLIE